MKFYIHKEGRKAIPSVAENKIIEILNKLKIEYYREVSFEGLGDKKNPSRFDFYIPKFELIIEYDGSHHNTTEARNRDIIKNRFCRKNGIKIVRFDKAEYYNLDFHITNLVTDSKLKFQIILELGKVGIREPKPEYFKKPKKNKPPKIKKQKKVKVKNSVQPYKSKSPNGNKRPNVAVTWDDVKHLYSKK